MEPPSFPRSQQKKEGRTVLLHAAYRSPSDHTGRVRCLSCGSRFASHEALAAHLTKHGGVNALDYKSTNIVATTNETYRNAPIERPPLLLNDAILDATRKPQQSGKRNKRERISAADVKGQQNKATPTKRSILIQQILSQNQKLTAYHCELDVLKTKTDPTSLDPEIKTQMKKMQGCINASETELHMALTAVNRKFTFRQLVMIEFLYGQLQEWIESNDRSPAPPAVDDVVAMEMVDKNDLHLYDEADLLFDELEAKRAVTESESSSRLIHTRRDPESGKMFIVKPSFLGSSTASKESMEMIGHPVEQVMDETEGAMPEAACMDDRVDDDFQNVVGTSSDDDMWGFSNVLVEWANAAKHKNAHSLSVPPKRDTVFEIESEKASLTGDGSAELNDVDNVAVFVVHASKKAIDVNQTTQQQSPDNSHIIPMTVMDTPGLDAPDLINGSNTVDENKDKTGRCIFIRPHLGIMDEERKPSLLSKQSRDKNNKRQKASVGGGPINGRTHIPDHADSHAVATSMTDPKLLDDAVHALLCQLNAKQHEHMRHKKSRQRWMVTGFSEVSKHLARGSVQLLIVAQHLDVSIQFKISEIEAIAEDNNVPVVHALTRKKIGQIYHPRKRMSIVAVLDIRDLEESFLTVIRMNDTPS